LDRRTFHKSSATCQRAIKALAKLQQANDDQKTGTDRLETAVLVGRSDCSVANVALAR
jgi:hypothetical protein